MSVSEQLRKLPLFRELTPRESEILKQHLRSRYLEMGEDLFLEGDFGRSCFVVLSGCIGVYKDMGRGKQERLAGLDGGAIVGHMALIDNKPRSATCTAEEKSVLLELGRAEFDQLFSARSPFAFKILDKVAMDLVFRLRGATEKLTEAKVDADNADTSNIARTAAELLAGYDTSDVDLDGIDLDQITVEIPDMSKRMNAPRY